MSKPEHLLALALNKRREFFKRWNEWQRSDEAYRSVFYKLEKLLPLWSDLPKPRLPRGIRFISIVDESYPQAFFQLPQPPLGIFIQGRWPLKKNLVSVVGSRRPTPYAMRLTRACVEKLLQLDRAVVSGGALGIDGLAHEISVEKSQPTLVVLGSGLQHWYPQRHQFLFSEVIKKGGALISEYPPWEKLRPYYFPERNRLIAALGDQLLLAQAHAKSGSLSTANTALDLGKEIWVLRPPPQDENFRGSQELLEAGAVCISSAQELDAITLSTEPVFREF